MYDVKENVRCEGEGGVIPLKEKRYFFRRQQGSAPQHTESAKPRASLAPAAHDACSCRAQMTY